MQTIDAFVASHYTTFDYLSYPGSRIDSQVNSCTTSALNWTPRRDPLVLDLDGDGITTSAINTAAPILFDQESAGIKTATGWIASGEAIVVRNLNGNGKIDSGRELVGDNTVLTCGLRAGQIASNGFEALADLDSNSDSKFDIADTAYASVKLWKDANQNGISEAGELFTFEQLSVNSINLSTAASNVNLVNGSGQATGNTQTFTGTFTKTNGITGAAGTAELAASLLLANNKFYRQFSDDPAITTAAQALPQMQGSGAVRDLGPTLSLGSAQAGALQSALAQFAQDSTRDQQLSHFDALVQSWGKTSAMPTSIQTRSALANSAAGSGSATAVAEFARNRPTRYAQITAREQFNGQTILDKWVVTTGKISLVTFSAQQEAFIGQAYAAFTQSVPATLVVQTRLKPYLDSVGLVINNNGTSLNTAPLVDKLNAYKQLDERGALLDLAEINRYAGDKLQTVGLNGFVLFGSWMDALPIDSPLRAEDAAAATTVAITAGTGLSVDDIYVGDNTANRFSAGAGNDRVYGSAGADTLSGDAGNDTPTKAEGLMCSACANLNIVTKLGERCPSSRREIKLRSRPASNASFSCDKPRARRNCRNTSPKASAGCRVDCHLMPSIVKSIS